MKYIAVLLVFFSIPAWSYDQMIERKRAQAEAMRMQTMQQIQHRQANPESFLQRKNKPTDEVEKTVSFDAGSNGHFYVPAALNGKNVDFIADTGASDIFLTQEDAKKIGISTYNLNYSLIYNTANGQVKAAQTNVQSLAVGPIVLNNIPVSISENNGGVSLLGMAFFNKLSRYEVKEGKLTLYQ